MCGRVVCVARGACMAGSAYVVGGAYVVGVCMVRGPYMAWVHAWQEGMHVRGRHAWQERRPLQRTVRILLECILVLKYFQLYVRSSDVDRTIMSAECVLTGMYPTIPQQSWNPDYRWQPTSQHTVPQGEDHVSQFTSQTAYSNIRTKHPSPCTGGGGGGLYSEVQCIMSNGYMGPP